MSFKFGLSSVNNSKAPIEIPMRYPPIKLTVNVPKGNSGCIVFNKIPIPQRLQAPMAAANPMYKKFFKIILKNAHDNILILQ